ncbi:hypothetical protein KP509_12G052600 [Ceratopteris richardii]|uniref:Plant heme peroxidase family profile domain-containing protein n=1 Tax=Ceratopteris richardii TaxID=49495 RepID=A0A8T2TLT7_CERRI|nr:hypothetical protein KP509_12G052600 [Ceratopteris richardii]KAH7423381.1 hypothetical protein KP509_12G052600 [Ceratopteris richardii]
MGGHTIGRAHCSSFAGRFTLADSILDPNFESKLESISPKASPRNMTNLDVVTPNTFDNQYQYSLASQRGLLASNPAQNFDSKLEQRCCSICFQSTFLL